MSTKNETTSKPAAIDLNDLLKKLAFHWPLYLILTLLSVLGAFIYLKYANPRYMSSAKLYLKDEKKGGGEEMDMLKSLSLFNSGKNIENEMEVIKSPILIAKVIRNNHFNIRYYRKQTVRNEELYENSPFNITILTDTANIGNYVFDVTPFNAGLKVKAEYGDDQTKAFTAKSGVPFTVGNDQFIITYSGKGNNLPAMNDYRIRIDSIAQLANEKMDDIGTALVNKDATVILVTYEDPVAARAAHFINALLETYNDYTLDDKNRVALKTINFLSVRIDSLRDELGYLEKQEERFKVQRGITDIEGTSKLALEQVKDADIKLNDANMQLSIFDQVENYLNAPGTSYPFAPMLGTVDQTLTAMINRYEELLKEKNKLSLSLQPSSMIVQNLDGQIEEARNTIKNYISGYKRNAGVAQSQMQQKVNQIQAKIANIPAYEREYINIKRQQGVKESLYLYLLKKKEEAAVSYASNVTDNKIIAPAFIPEKPESPKKTMAFVGFLAIGLALSTLYIYLKYFLNNKILSKTEIEQLFELPLMAEIYQDDEETTKNLSLQNRSVLLEQIFNLRTNLRYLLSEHTDSTTILITSSISGEGKTFLSAHLGNSLTVNKRKVILLELDLRKPKLSRYLGLDNYVGITNYIVENKSIDEIIRKVPNTDLHLISSGPIPPNPVELIEGNRMRTLLNTLKERYDYIIIDTAPIGIVSDAKSLAPYIDASLFVVRYNFTLKSKLKAVAESLKEGHFHKTGIIFNGIEQNSFYPNYYYDHYSYSQENLKAKRWFAFFKKLKHRLA
ncbi:GumC family protein [Chitinophaga sancti]|uniref:non-specific protein-tyrosine kinase n=1 Tax=Chitinophaga sancti TaxID=1004 RepID=A0A1K1LRC6_9BACT|nr:polysaccharide biosynthesis tyrosine autokinase [Chitinophaga sancti]WQD65009.1 polysaccharide biosynthesis tyrosine autokinase [Chitinophaga sancti]WQG89367.1 polysaccharide biosynthesis tyrosine autokinase [Chitinophaga sancti]SFW12198.1 capsular exopolysaccharide family [Chitinophaga sancti]